MHRILSVVLLSAAAVGQSVVPVDQEPHHHQVLQNDRARAFLVDLGPGEEMPMHRHERGYIGVLLTNAQLTTTTAGKAPTKVRGAADTTDYYSAPLIHSVRNDSAGPVRSLEIELAEPRGAATPSKQPLSRYCNPGSNTACVEEKYLFCTEKVCVSDVTMGEGAITTRHSHTTDHMMVALSDYRLSDNVEGRGANLRVEQPGGVEYLAAGITHQITNMSRHSIRFLVIVWK